MKRTLFTAVFLAALLSVYPLAAYAKDKDCGKKDKCASCEMKEKECKVGQLKSQVKLLKSHQEALGISDKQMADIKKIKVAAIKELIQQQADIDITAVDVKSEMMAAAINVDTVNKLIDKKYAAKGVLAKSYIKAIADIQQVLTEEQRAGWKTMIDKAHDGSGCPKDKSGKYCPITGKWLGEKK